MNQQIEIEFKNLLSKNEYNTLVAAYFPSEKEPFTQCNVYFDTEDMLLRKNHCALRIRIKENSSEWTLKTPFEGHHKETNVSIDFEESHNLVKKSSVTIPDDIITALSNENIVLNEPVFKIAQLKTERLEIMTKNGLIVLDKSYYANETDYELEVESDSDEAGLELFNTIIDTHSLTIRKTENKISRAFSAYQKLRTS